MRPPRDAHRVVIVTDDPGWHGRVLGRGLAARGYEVVMLSLKDCHLDAGAAPPFVHLPGFDAALPAGVFVRGVPGGTLEEVILRLDVLHTLALLGVPVFNSGRAIERSVDKALTSVLLSLAGIPTPRTWVFEDRAKARALTAARLAAGGRLVLKPLFGSQGEGLALIESLDAFDATVPVNGVWYLQDFVERGGPPYRDWRVLVVAGTATHAMSRTSGHWITNRAQGARCEAAILGRELDDAARMLAERAAQALEMDYAGVDLLRDGDGRWLVGEVNGVPAWWGLQQACGPTVSDTLIAAFVARLHAAA
ncbi:MAG: RimK family alpha-L-glutamate ligase [Gammaproteobacteria bacterium]